MGYSPWGHKELDTPRHTCTYTCALAAQRLPAADFVQVLSIFNQRLVPPETQTACMSQPCKKSRVVPITSGHT